MKRFVPVVLTLLFAGCAEPEPVRHRVSGAATVDGKDIPYGEILFTPNGAQQNSGPQGIAIIRDGKFDTAHEGKGIAGGPTVVRVTGLTKQGGKLLCEHELQVDLPRSDSTQTFNVPARSAPATTSGRPEI
jgi:hypothetical protein